MDHQSQSIYIEKFYLRRKFFSPKEAKAIVSTKSISFSEISLHNSFEVEYFPNQRRISFKLKYYFVFDFKGNEEKRIFNYLAYENDELTLVNYEYFFEVGYTQGEKSLLSNQSFFLKIPGSEKYLWSTSTSRNGVNSLRIKEFSEKSPEQFYFHLRHIHDNSGLSIADSRKINTFWEMIRLSGVLTKLMTTQIKSAKKMNRNYREIVEMVRKDLLKFGVRQPKRDKDFPETPTWWTGMLYSLIFYYPRFCNNSFRWGKYKTGDSMEWEVWFFRTFGNYKTDKAISHWERNGSGRIWWSNGAWFYVFNSIYIGR